MDPDSAGTGHIRPFFKRHKNLSACPEFGSRRLVHLLIREKISSSKQSILRLKDRISTVTIGLANAKESGMDDSEDGGPVLEQPGASGEEAADVSADSMTGGSETDNGSVTSSVSVASTVSAPAAETEQESAAKYCEGGYHPIRIADVIDDRYHVVRKIGFGHFSTVWLTWDSTSPVHDPEFRALKVSKSERVFADATLTEIKILQKVSDADPSHDFRKFVCGILDNFAVQSPNGTHVCMVQHCHGENLLQLIQRGDHKGLPEANVKSITKQMLQGLHYLHAVCGIVHTDIKPENILIEVSPARIKKMAMGAVVMHRKGEKMPAEYVGSHELVEPAADDQRPAATPAAAADQKKDPAASPWKFPEETITSILEMEHSEPDPAMQDCEISIKIADFGNACYVDHHYTYLIQTLPYRSMEVVIKAEYGPAADVWSTACVAFEIATGDYLFDGMVGDRFAKTEDHLGHIVELLGNVPLPVLRKGKHYRKYFTPRGHLKKHHPKRFWPLTDVLIEKYLWPEERATAFSSLLHPMLHYDQEKRLAAEPASLHPYLSSP